MKDDKKNENSFLFDKKCNDVKNTKVKDTKTNILKPSESQAQEDRVAKSNSNIQPKVNNDFTLHENQIKPRQKTRILKKCGTESNLIKG